MPLLSPSEACGIPWHFGNSGYLGNLRSPAGQERTDTSPASRAGRAGGWHGPAASPGVGMWAGLSGPQRHSKPDKTLVKTLLADQKWSREMALGNAKLVFTPSIRVGC